jgi:hypothetical protein
MYLTQENEATEIDFVARPFVGLVCDCQPQLNIYQSQIYDANGV